MPTAQRHQLTTAALALAAVLAAASWLAAVALASTPSKTETSSKSQVTTKSPDKLPVTMGKYKKGTALPKGWAVVSRKATVTRGKSGTTSKNSVKLSCPSKTSIIELEDSEQLGKPMPFTYDKEQTFGRTPVFLYPTARDISVGKSRTGTLYGLCSPYT